MAERFDSIEDIAFVERIDGAAADPGRTPTLLVEVPHGADRRAHYERYLAKMRGALPADLHVFFHVNTDVGAWQYGRRVAERALALRPDASALLVRCLVPRTFIDTNRLPDAGDSTAKDGMTPAMAPYIPAEDRDMLRAAHEAYVALVARAYRAVCDAGGFALSPHTYGPRVLPIAKIDHEIVTALRHAHTPEVIEGCGMRAEIDLITRTSEGHRIAPAGMVEELIAGYRALGYEAVESGSYKLSPVTQSWRWIEAYPEQVLCLEVRRDLLVERWTPFEEQTVREDAAEIFATPLADAIAKRLPGRAS